MKTTNGETITYNDSHRHKYDSAMAEYLDTVGEDDDWTGDVEWIEYVQRFGKRLLFTDDRGFVTCERYPSEADAIESFETIDAAYNEWQASEEESY